MAKHAPVRSGGSLPKIEFNVNSVFQLINTLEDLIGSVKASILSLIAGLTKRVETLENAPVSATVTALAAPVFTNTYERTFTDAAKNTIEIGSLSTATYTGSSYIINLDCTESGYEFSGTHTYTGFGNDTADAWKLLYWNRYSDKNTPTAPAFLLEVKASATTTTFRARVTR
jgi:hypothetical protein